MCWNSCFVWVSEHVLKRLFTSFKVRVTLDTEPWPSSWEQREERVEARAKSDNCRDAARTIPNVQGWQSAGLSDSEDLGDIVMKKSRYRWFISEVGNKMSNLHRFYIYIYISEDYDVKWLLVNSLELCQWHYPIWCLRVEINDTKECCKTPRLGRIMTSWLGPRAGAGAGNECSEQRGVTDDIMTATNWISGPPDTWVHYILYFTNQVVIDHSYSKLLAIKCGPMCSILLKYWAFVTDYQKIIFTF